MFSKGPTRSRASLLQRDGHEAASFFHRAHRAVDQNNSESLQPTPHSSPQLAIALASGLVPLGRSTRSGPIGPTQSLQRTSDPADPAGSPPGPFPVLVQPSLDFPARDWTQKDSGGGSRFTRATADHRVLLLT